MQVTMRALALSKGQRGGGYNKDGAAAAAGVSTFLSRPPKLKR